MLFVGKTTTAPRIQNETNRKIEKGTMAEIQNGVGNPEALRKGQEVPLRKQIGNFLNEQFSRLGRVKDSALGKGKSLLQDGWANIKRGWQKPRGVGEAAAAVPGKVIDKVTSGIGPETAESRDEKLAEVLAKLSERYQKVAQQVENAEDSEQFAQDLRKLQILLEELEKTYLALTEMRARIGNRINLSDTDKQVSREIDTQQARFDAQVVQAEALLKRLEGPSIGERVATTVENLGRRTFTKDGRLEAQAEKLRKKGEKASESYEESVKKIEGLVAQIADVKAELEATQTPQGAESREVLREQLQDLEAKLEAEKRKRDELYRKSFIHGFNAEIVEQRRKLEELKKKKDDPDALEEIASVLRIIRSLEQARDSHIEKFGGDPTESNWSKLTSAVNKGFAETGRMAVWSAKELLRDKEEQAFWLILQVLAGAAGGAPLLLGVSATTLLREAVRSGVIPGEKIPVLKKFLSARESADVYQNIAGQGPKEFLQELAAALPEDPEDLNMYQKGFRQVMRFMGGALSLVGTPLVWADKKILGVLNQGTEKRGVGYARDLATLLEGANAENIQGRFDQRLRGYFNVDALQAMVNEGNFEAAQEEVARMEQMLRDIANIREQGGAIAGGEAFGLRKAQFDNRMFAPDVLDAWENALMDILISVAGLANVNNESLRSRLSALPKESGDEALAYLQKIHEKAANSRKRLAFAARTVRIAGQTAGVHVVQDILRGQPAEVSSESTSTREATDSGTADRSEAAESTREVRPTTTVVTPPEVNVESDTETDVEPAPVVVRPEPVPPTIPEGTDPTLNLDSDTELNYVTEVNGEQTIDTSLPGWQVWGQQELGFDNPWNYYNQQVENMRDSIITPDVHSVDEYLPVNGMTNILADLTPLGPDGIGEVPIIPNETIADMTEYYWNSANQGEPVWEAMNVMRNGTPTIEQINTVREAFNQPLIEQP